MSTFEEQFPSLNNKKWELKFQEHIDDSTAYFISTVNVKDYCLDKQKVREAIRKVQFTDTNDLAPDNCHILIVEDLLKELGL